MFILLLHSGLQLQSHRYIGYNFGNTIFNFEHIRRSRLIQYAQFSRTIFKHYMKASSQHKLHTDDYTAQCLFGITLNIHMYLKSRASLPSSNHYLAIIIIFLPLIQGLFVLNKQKFFPATVLSACPLSAVFFAKSRFLCCKQKNGTAADAASQVP